MNVFSHSFSFLHGIRTMKFNIATLLYFIYFLNTIYCYDSESKSKVLDQITFLNDLINFKESRILLGSESNRIEVSPFYDTIIYSDIADIINDFENNGVSTSLILSIMVFRYA